jgi:hypothetical protein
MTSFLLTESERRLGDCDGAAIFQKPRQITKSLRIPYVTMELECEKCQDVNGLPTVTKLIARTITELWPNRINLGVCEFATR